MVLQAPRFCFYPTAIGSEPYDLSLDTHARWQRAMRGHAVANAVPVVAANRIGVEENDGATQSYYGHSFIADHTGELVASFGDKEEGVLIAELRSCRDRARYPRRMGLLPRPPRLTSTPKVSCRSLRRLSGSAHMPAMAQIDWPVSALVLKAARNRATSATSSTVVNSLSTVSASSDLLDHALLADAELLRLLGDLLLDERRLHEAWADDIGAHVVRAHLPWPSPARGRAGRASPSHRPPSAARPRGCAPSPYR